MASTFFALSRIRASAMWCTLFRDSLRDECKQSTEEHHTTNIITTTRHEDCLLLLHVLDVAFECFNSIISLRNCVQGLEIAGAVAFDMDTVHELSSQAPTEQENWYFSSHLLICYFVLGSLTSENREVYRDAFAPPQDTRRPKPWERSSVPAHAPRLQGQKIWKKAGVKIRNNKENEAALLELQSEGNGARKKRKVWTAKENIADALWQSALSVPEPFIYNQDNTDVNNGDHAATGGRDDAEDNALRFVPRKRTNTDHVITPRKPLRQTHLNSQAQTLSAVPNEALSNISTRRKKSMRRSSIRKSTNMRASARFSSGDRKSVV